MSSNPRLKRQARKRRGETGFKLNITSMMDMFTIILVFLIKNYSTDGAMLTPAEDLTLPTSTAEKAAREALSVKIAQNSISVEGRVVIGAALYAAISDQSEFLIDDLYEVLREYAQRATELAVLSGQEFSGQITVQGDSRVPYGILTRIMYTCGQAGYPDINLIVYRQE